MPGTVGLADAAVPLVDHLLVGGTGGRSRQLRRLAAGCGTPVSSDSPVVTAFTVARTVVRG